MSQSERARYAIYFTPEADCALWRFGTLVVGYDAITGADVDPAPIAHIAHLLPPAVQVDPRRYGFHATLKAPFELLAHRTIDELLARAADFTRTRTAFALGRLKPTLLGGFIALTCEAPPAALGALASDCVRAFEPFRAPLAPADRERRTSGLTPHQLAQLDAWGYPYVFEDFLFHMTLTGRLPPDTAPTALQAIATLHAPLAASEVVLDAISVLEQPTRDGRFRLIARFPLAPLASG